MRTLDPQSLTQHVDRLYRAAWALCGSREDAEDLVQETFARVLARPRVLTGDDDLYYLMRVLRNTFFTNRRTASRRPLTVATLEDVNPADPRQLGEPERALEMQEVYATIATLPEDRRLVACGGGRARSLLQGSRTGVACARGNDHDQTVPGAQAGGRAAGAQVAPARVGVQVRFVRAALPRAGFSRSHGRIPLPVVHRARQSAGMRRGPPESCQVEERHDRTAYPYPGRAAAHRRVVAHLRHARAPIIAPTDRVACGHSSEASSRAAFFSSPSVLCIGSCERGSDVIAVIVVAIAVIPGGGGASTLSLRQAAAPTLRAATLPAPSQSAHTRANSPSQSTACHSPIGRTVLAGAAAERAADLIDGRMVTTVFYSDSRGQRIGYAIFGAVQRHRSKAVRLFGAVAFPTGCSPRTGLPWSHGCATGTCALYLAMASPAQRC